MNHVRFAKDRLSFYAGGASKLLVRKHSYMSTIYTKIPAFLQGWDVVRLFYNFKIKTFCSCSYTPVGQRMTMGAMLL